MVLGLSPNPALPHSKHKMRERFFKLSQAAGLLHTESQTHHWNLKMKGGVLRICIEQLCMIYGSTKHEQNVGLVLVNLLSFECLLAANCNFTF